MLVGGHDVVKHPTKAAGPLLRLREILDQHRQRELTKLLHMQRVYNRWLRRYRKNWMGRPVIETRMLDAEERIKVLKESMKKTLRRGEYAPLGIGMLGDLMATQASRPSIALAVAAVVVLIWIDSRLSGRTQHRNA